MIRCSDCSREFAIVASTGLIRRHKPCWPTIQRKRKSFRVCQAPPLTLTTAKKQPIKENNHECHEIKDNHESSSNLEKRKTLEERFLYPYETAKRLKTCVNDSMHVYWLDANCNFYDIATDTPYADDKRYNREMSTFFDAMKSDVAWTTKEPTSKLFHKSHVSCNKKAVWCKVYWNSNYGYTDNLCEGEWEYQYVDI